MSFPDVVARNQKQVECDAVRHPKGLRVERCRQGCLDSKRRATFIQTAEAGLTGKIDETQPVISDSSAEVGIHEPDDPGHHHKDGDVRPPECPRERLGSRRTHHQQTAPREASDTDGKDSKCEVRTCCAILGPDEEVHPGERHAGRCHRRTKDRRTTHSKSCDNRDGSIDRRQRPL